MTLNATKLGLATAIVSALFWVICSVIVVLSPRGMMQMSGQLAHSDFAGMGWSMHWTGLLVGLVAWSVLSGLFVWAIAAVYNRLIK